MSGVGRMGAFFLYDRHESHGNVELHGLRFGVMGCHSSLRSELR